MKKIIRIILCAVCLILGLNLLLAGCLNYALNYKKTVCDTSVSPDGRYELSLTAIGEAKFPFGPASGRLILMEEDAQISQAEFELYNDGGNITSSCWAVTWNDDYVEVILSGQKQYDEQIILYYDGTMERQTLKEETEPTATEPEALNIEVMENRENELVFNISIQDYIRNYNVYYKNGYCRDYLTAASQWQCYTYDSAIHSQHETLYYYFTEDERVYSLPTISVYVPANGDYIQEITVNFDEHSYSESGYEQYKEMCYFTLKVFFPELDDERLFDLCTEIITLGNQNVFTSDEWYDSDAVPYALFHKDGIGVYSYFAIGDWEHFCIIPVTDETIAEFEEKGTIIYEIE